ncbi:hypothetical protein [Nocardia sp. NPDC004604]|uniref:hypothetical protein n=1 Tax=Nocardia sp. NPDC004604 TaxID=3157013 RepID=UPI0033AEF861
MTTLIHQPPPDQDPTRGAPTPPSSTGWSTRKTLAAVGIAGVIAAAGGGIIYAASSSDNGGNHGPGGPGMSMNGQPGQIGAGPGGAMTGPPLHGQVVVSDGNGGYRTELTQTGTITALSSTSVTAKSADDYTQTYTITATTTGATSVKVGDTVTIRGTQTDDTNTATAVGTTTGAPNGMNGGPGPQGGEPGGSTNGLNGSGMGRPMDGLPTRPSN